MTAQTNDTVTYDDECYAIAGIHGEGLFNPASLGLEPRASCTACWRGFISHYEVKAGQLMLVKLLISRGGLTPPPTIFGTDPDPVPEFPSLAGKRPTREERKLISRVVRAQSWELIYRNIDQSIAYTGGLLLGVDFIDEMYVHMGFHPAYKYRRVLELIFDQGRLMEETDLSAEMEQFRIDIGGNEETPHHDQYDEWRNWIRRRHTRD